MIKEVGGNPAATDCTRVLRLPGFADKKYGEDYAKCVLARGEHPEEVLCRIADYRVDGKHDPSHCARQTVKKAQADLQLKIGFREPSQAARNGATKRAQRL